MKSGDFFWLRGDSKKGTAYLDERDRKGLVSITMMQNYLAGRKVPDRPIELTLKGSRIGGFLPGRMALFVTDPVLKLFDDEKVTGWKTYPLNVVDKNSKVIVGIHGLQVVGRAGPLTARAQKDDSIDFKSTSWDGSDLFVLEETWLVIVHPRVVEILEKNKIKGAVWTRLSEID